MSSLGLILCTILAQAASTASPSPSPSPSVAPALTIGVSGSNVFIDQATTGPGITPPEGPGFAKGSPLSPMSPYDWFTSAPVTPGVAGVLQYQIAGSYTFDGMTLNATLGLAELTGSTTNALYWSEPLIPNLNVHAQSHLVPYAIVFPTHAGQDDASIFSPSLLSAELASSDKSWRVRGGYFDLLQTDRFVFAPPALTSVTPGLGPATATTLGPGMPSIDAWPSSPTTLPLLGGDAFVKHGSASFELTDALLPSLDGTNARLVMGSLVFDRGDYGRFSFQAANVWTTGAPIATTTFYGVNPQTYPGPQGRLFTSTLANQNQTIGGGRAFFHPLAKWDALVELGRAWYDAGLVAHPGTQHFGNYEHYALARHLGDDVATIEYHRFDPTYATVILPYGVPENIWSAAWSWPGVWLKSTYQMVDNTTIGANRAGFHFRYDHNNKVLEAHADYGDWRQLIPETFANATQNGFVDGYFLLQRNRFGTFGHDRHIGLYVAWHLPKDDLVFDSVEDYLARQADPGQAIDTVAMRTPALVGSWQHHFSKTLLAVGGYGRYEAVGAWATTPVDAIYGIGFAGVQFATGPKSALLVEGRHYGLVGLPSAVGGLPPTMTGSSLVVDQRFSL
ncbi:MAG: hypothetical protein JO175_09720 [Candidatus Eremiobacteraeota bacterium]|nr:hypothetical protein [Candidatus Eremiobacteraeota bacterium]